MFSSDYSKNSMQTTLRRLVVAAPVAAVIGINADVVASIHISSTPVSAGSSSTGTVTVSGLCKSCAAIVALTSSTPSVASVPASATTSNGISGGTATFTVRAQTGAAGCSVITAKVGTSVQSAVLTVRPSAPSGGLALTLKTPTTVGGGVDSGFVSLPPVNAALASNPVAQLSTSDPNIATVPASVTLKPTFIEGGIIIYRGGFPISTRDSGRQTCAGITATSGTSKAQTLLQIFTISG